MTATTDMTSLGIKEEDLNLLRNDRIKFDCGPFVYRIIIDWGFAKPDGISIKDHFDYLKISENVKDKFNGKIGKWVTKYETKLNKFSFAELDITTLHEFLPVLCHEKIAQTFTPKYNEQIEDPHTVESLLKEIKDFRNDVSHEYGEAVKDSHIVEMREKMGECISVAGKLYWKDQTEIDIRIKELDDVFDKVIHDTTHFYENRVIFIETLIETEVPAMLLERYSPHFLVPLPGNCRKTDTADIFQCSNLSLTTEKNIKIIFCCTEIHNNIFSKLIIINGGPGSGKTTLMKNMCQDILQTVVHGGTPRYKKNEQFKIPIFIECRNEQPTSLALFLKECLKNIHSPEDDIYEAFKNLKGLVFIIDGYDEITDTCRKLVDSIIVFCRDYNATCIVSSRVDAGNNLINDLLDKNLNFTSTFIEPISDVTEKVNFLRSYADKMDNTIDADLLVNHFESLTESPQEVFSSPILLALFISLFVEDPESLSKLKNEQSAYEAVRSNFLREMERKLRKIKNSRKKAVDVVNVLSKYCLNLFRAKKYFLGEKDYLKMVDDCENIRGMREDVDIYSLLSCILTPEHSFKYINKISYQFMHSTIQEYFAAKYISENISGFQDGRGLPIQSEDEPMTEFLQALGLDESQPDIKEEIERCGNIIKYLMLEFLANEELQKYRRAFTLLLEKYFKQRNNSTVYHLDLILSSDSNEDVISIISACMKGWENYHLEYYKHINPFIGLMNKMEIKGSIQFSSFEVTNTQLIMKLLTAMDDGSEVELCFGHSFSNYLPLDGEIFRQLEKSKLHVTKFLACVASEEHFSTIVRVFRGDFLDICTLSVSDISFAASKELTCQFGLRVKYTDSCPSTGSNPVRDGTELTIEYIPENGVENVYKAVKYICPESKEFYCIYLDLCYLKDHDILELQHLFHRDKIRTKFAERTEVMERTVYENKSRFVEFILAESEPEKGGDKEEEMQREGEEKKDEECGEKKEHSKREEQCRDEEEIKEYKEGERIEVVVKEEKRKEEEEDRKKTEKEEREDYTDNERRETEGRDNEKKKVRMITDGVKFERRTVFLLIFFFSILSVLMVEFIRSLFHS